MKDFHNIQILNIVENFMFYWYVFYFREFLVKEVVWTNTT